MRSSTSALAALAIGASAASAVSTSSIVSTLSSFLSSDCKAALGSVLSPTSPTGQCLRTDMLASALNETGSLIPDVDMYLSSVCASNPCTNTTLQNATQTILDGCATDLTRFGSSFGLSNQTVELFFELQPIAREVLCLKTMDPYSSANATMPMMNSTMFNTTNGTFCASSFLSDLSSYLGAPLTLNYVETLVLGGNATALKSLESIPPSMLCSDCIFAAVDIIELQYPTFANVTLMGHSLNTVLSSNCSSMGLELSANGTLPMNITEAAMNSSFPYNLTNGMTNYTATATMMPSTANISGIIGNLTNGAGASSAIASATGAAGNTTALKMRWIGA